MPENPPVIEIDRAALAAAAAVLRDPKRGPITFGPMDRGLPDGFVIHVADGRVAAAIKTLAEAGPGLVDALARAEGRAEAQA